MIEGLVNNIVFFAGCLSVLLSAGQLWVKNRRLANYNLAALFFCLGVILLQLSFLSDGTTRDYPGIMMFHLTFLYLITPLLYFAYNLVVLNEDSLPRWKMTLFLLPTFIVFMIDVYFLFITSNEKWIVSACLFSDTMSPVVMFARALFMGAAVQILVYLSMLFRKLLVLWKVGDQPPVAFITMLYIIFSIIGDVILSMGYILSSMGVLRAGMFMVSVMIIVSHLVGQRHPKFLQMLVTETSRKRYERSMLQGLDLNALAGRLKVLMDHEKMYADEDITLGSLAKALSVTPHQLSEFMNERYNMNFRSFINRHRIREAERILVEEPDSSILSIAFVIGFNSKTTFFRAFEKQTGMRPQEYRKLKLHGS
jgi:AraC-like DNA-binding protein